MVHKNKLTYPLVIYLVNDSNASHGVGVKTTDFESFKCAPPILPIKFLGINCIINFSGQVSAFLKNKKQ